MKFMIACPNCDNTDLEVDIDGFKCIKCSNDSFHLEECVVINEECD